MKIKNEIVGFNYTKANGDKSNRSVFVISPPSDKLFGIDLTEFDSFEKAEFRKDIAEIMSRHWREIEAELDTLDISQNFRQFFENKIDNLEIEEYDGR